MWTGEGVTVALNLSTAPYDPDAWEWSQCGLASNESTFNPWTGVCSVECYMGQVTPCNQIADSTVTPPAGCGCSGVSIFRLLKGAKLQPGGCSYGYTGAIQSPRSSLCSP